MLLCLETSQQQCSVALGLDGNLVAISKSEEPNSHGKRITGLVDETLKAAGISSTQLQAIAVSAGPGSYTGLRIGSSTAKGLCFGWKLPLISIPSLQLMAYQMQQLMPNRHYCPLIDARRMEVFTGLYSSSIEEILLGEPAIIDSRFMQETLLHTQVVFGGSGLPKSKPFLANSPSAFFVDDLIPTAESMVALAQAKFARGDFEDPAYFEPSYLKEFHGTKPKAA